MENGKRQDPDRNGTKTEDRLWRKGTAESDQPHKASIIGMDQARKSAVCIPLIDTADGFDVLFEIRSSQIQSQPGDVCFPGGMVEPGETEAQAAVRR